MLKRCPLIAAGVIFERHERFLIFSRLKHFRGWAGVAGHIELGESAHKGVVREAFEEVGVRITCFEEALPPLIIPAKGCARSGPEIGEHEWRVYRALRWEGEPRNCEPDKHINLRWASVDELRQLFWNEPHDPAWFLIFRKLGMI